MVGLLTWTTYGTWLSSAGRGWIDRGGSFGAGEQLPTPDPAANPTHRQRGLVWPPVALRTDQRELVCSDLERIAALRGFTVLAAVAKADHIRVLVSLDAGRDIHRLVHDVKGSLSRTLSMAEGDPPARTQRGAPLVHHKWWSRQYSFLTVADDQVSEVRASL